MRFLPVLAIIVLIAVVLQPVPSKAEAETLADPLAEVRKQNQKTTTLSPKDLFLKHARPTTKEGHHRKAITTTTTTTTTLAPSTSTSTSTVKPKNRGKPKSKGTKQSKGRPARKNRAQCVQCSTSTTVVTHMEKKAQSDGDTKETPSILADNQTMPNAAPVVMNQLYSDRLFSDMAINGRAPLADNARGVVRFNGAYRNDLVKANLIGLVGSNMTLEDSNM